jgi:hypothetical protein
LREICISEVVFTCFWNLEPKITFEDETIFSMIPAPRQTGLDYSALTTQAGSGKYKGLCSAVIYSPNASGKINLIGDFTIPTTNNATERYLRNYKRKQKQAISFRSFASIEDLCDGKSMLIKIRKIDGANVFQEVARRFDS